MFEILIATVILVTIAAIILFLPKRPKVNIFYSMEG